jgi:hypothetical protein
MQLPHLDKGDLVSHPLSPETGSTSPGDVEDKTNMTSSAPVEDKHDLTPQLPTMTHLLSPNGDVLCRMGSWTMPVFMGGIDVDFVVDSGAVTSIISLEMWRSFTMKPTLQQDESLTLRGVLNTNLKILGLATFTMNIGSWSGRHTFAVCDIRVTA